MAFGNGIWRGWALAAALLLAACGGGSGGGGGAGGDPAGTGGDGNGEDAPCTVTGAFEGTWYGNTLAISSELVAGGLELTFDASGNATAMAIWQGGGSSDTELAGPLTGLCVKQMSTNPAVYRIADFPPVGIVGPLYLIPNEEGTHMGSVQSSFAFGTVTVGAFQKGDAPAQWPPVDDYDLVLLTSDSEAEAGYDGFRYTGVNGNLLADNTLDTVTNPPSNSGDVILTATEGSIGFGPFSRILESQITGGTLSREGEPGDARHRRGLFAGLLTAGVDPSFDYSSRLLPSPDGQAIAFLSCVDMMGVSCINDSGEDSDSSTFFTNYIYSWQFFYEGWINDIPSPD